MHHACTAVARFYELSAYICGVRGLTTHYPPTRRGFTTHSPPTRRGLTTHSPPTRRRLTTNSALPRPVPYHSLSSHIVALLTPHSTFHLTDSSSPCDSSWLLTPPFPPLIPNHIVAPPSPLLPPPVVPGFEPLVPSLSGGVTCPG